jgi:uncharacterized membrane protein YccC
LALVGERENGTYEQMLALPTSATAIVLGKLLPYVALCYMQVFVALVPAGLFLGYWPQGSWITLLIVTLPFVLASLGIGTYVSSLATTSAQAVFLSVFFILPSFVLRRDDALPADATASARSAAAAAPLVPDREPPHHRRGASLATSRCRRWCCA